MDTTEISVRHAKWSSNYNDLTNWLADQKIVARDAEILTRDESDAIFLAAETIGDAVILRGSDYLKTAYRKAFSICPELSEGTWLYFSYCQWLLRVLFEFEVVLQNPAMRLTEFYRQYEVKLKVFEELTKVLRVEQPDQAIQNSCPRFIELWLDIQDRASKLSSEWRQTVYAVAQDFNYQPKFGS